jgi:proline dehydrogenase
MDDLELMKTNIENMTKINQVEILKILLKHNVKINENKSGIFVNMSFLDKTIIEDIKVYLDYVKEQESTLQSLETKKEVFKTAFFE